MDAYRLYTVVPQLVAFIEQLTNIYVRYNRKRLKGRGAGDADCLTALTTLYDTLLMLCKVRHPDFVPVTSQVIAPDPRLMCSYTSRLSRPPAICFGQMLWAATSAAPPLCSERPPMLGACFSTSRFNDLSGIMRVIARARSERC